MVEIIIALWLASTPPPPPGVPPPPEVRGPKMTAPGKIPARQPPSAPKAPVAKPPSKRGAAPASEKSPPTTPAKKAPEKSPTEVVSSGEKQSASAAPQAPLSPSDSGPDAGLAKASKAVPDSEKQAIAPPEGTNPPALTRKALCGELTRTSKELSAARAKLEAEQKSINEQREELEKLKAEIAQARSGLRAETLKLESLLPAPGESLADRPKTTAKPLDLDALARTMKSMKPDSAAALLQRTDPTLAASLLRRMKPADAGAVMDRLKPDVAADLMTLMSTMPAPATKVGGRL